MVELCRPADAEVDKTGLRGAWTGDEENGVSQNTVQEELRLKAGDDGDEWTVTSKVRITRSTLQSPR